MEVKNTYNVYQTCIEMLKDRGYDLSHLPDISYEEFIIMYEQKNYDIQDKNNLIYIYFFKEIKNFSKKDLENVVSFVHNYTKNFNINIIIITTEKINITIQKELTNPLYRNIEIFQFKELIFNITKSFLVPQHIPITKDEDIKKILEKYQVSKNQIPKILSNDPVTRYFGLRPGSLFKIIRQSPSSGEYITYRLVR